MREHETKNCVMHREKRSSIRLRLEQSLTSQLPDEVRKPQTSLEKQKREKGGEG